MKVFDLACGHDHRFEGWFASAADFDEQLASGLIECPVCTDREVRKLPSAPRLNLSGAAEPMPAREPGQDGTASPVPGTIPAAAELQAMWMKLARQLIESTEDVGENFAEEARRIHYRETPERGIRGVATAEERAELADEGIEVFAFPLPRSLKDPIQ